MRKEFKLDMAAWAAYARACLLASVLVLVGPPVLAQVIVSGPTGTGGGDTLAFGNVQVGETRVMTVTYTAGATAVTFASPAAVATTAPFAVVDDQCANQNMTPAGKTCSITYSFTPTEARAYSESFRVDLDAASNTAGIADSYIYATGTGTPEPGASEGTVATPATGLDFGSVQTTATKVLTFTLTISNGDVTFADTDITVSAPFSISAADNGCKGRTLGPTQSCIIAVRFTPTAVTAYNSFINVPVTSPTNHPGVFMNLIGVGLSGGASTAGTLTISPASSQEDRIPISTIVGVSGSQILTLSATGGPVSISGVAVPNLWLINNLCGASVVPGQSCVIMLNTALYSAPGSYPEAYVLQTSEGPKIVYVSANVSDVATGASGTLNVSSTSLDFGEVRPGSASVKSITLSATGQNVALTSITVPNGYVESDSCGNLIPAGGSCTATITFSPTSEVSYKGSIVITSNAFASPHFVTLSGTGSVSAVQQALVSVSPEILDYGTLRPGSKLTKSVTVTSKGTNVALNGITMPSLGFTLTNSSCGTLIPAGGSCSVSITFAPTAKVPYDGSAVIDITDAPHFITLKGSGGSSTGSSGGGSEPILVLDTALIDFGDVASGSSSRKEVTLTNGGGTALTVSIGNSFPSSDYSAAIGSCGSGSTISLAAGASCTLMVSFSPSVVGVQTGSLTFSGVGSGNMAISLRGTGKGGSSSVSPMGGISATPTVLAFGSVGVGGALVKTITLSSNSSARPSILDIQAPSGFTASTNCAAVNGSSCTLTVAFVPVSANNYGGILVVNATDGSAVFITVSGDGTSGARLSARSNGSSQALDLTGEFRFAAEQASSIGNLYVAALYNDILYFSSGGLWTTYVPGIEPPAYVRQAGYASELTILLSQDVTSLAGATIFLGYGRDIGEVISNHQYTPVFVVE